MAFGSPFFLLLLPFLRPSHYPPPPPSIYIYKKNTYCFPSYIFSSLPSLSLLSLLFTLICLMSCNIRQECINNKNLAQCFDILNLRELTTYSTDRVLVTKAKADVVEAIIGGLFRYPFPPSFLIMPSFFLLLTCASELAEAIDRGDSIIRDAEAKSVLEELLAFVSHFSSHVSHFLSSQSSLPARILP